MRILYISANQTVYESLRARFEPMGFVFSLTASPQDAISAMQPGLFDCVVFDPALSSDPRMDVINLRRGLNNMPYVLLMGERAMTQEECLRIGGNESLPYSAALRDIDTAMENAQRVRDLIRRFGDEDEDFPSGAGVIAKSAFNQIFLASMDLPGRNYQLNYLLFIRIDNLDEIAQIDGPHGAEYARASLAKFLVQFRRQSDIVGHTARNEYTLLLQGLQGYDDALAAARRFEKALSEADSLLSSGVQDVHLSVALVAVPSGLKPLQEDIRKNAA